jgi:hypothetical protein
MVIKTESENLKKLREIVKEIDEKNFDFGNDNDYERLTKNIDDLIHVEMKKINCETNKDCKLKSYETLFTSIITLLEGTKHLI